MLSIFRIFKVLKPTVRPKPELGLLKMKKGKNDIKSRKNQLLRYFLAICLRSSTRTSFLFKYARLKLKIISIPNKKVTIYSEMVKNSAGSSMKDNSNVIIKVTYNNTTEITEFQILVTTSLG